MGMIKKIKVKNTFKLNCTGKPSTELINCKRSKNIAVLPSSINHIKPKLLLKLGDKVTTGMPLFIDKRDPQIQFCSPGSGTISKINYGPRRSLDEVIITLDEKETFVDFSTYTSEDITSLDRKDIVNYLANAGVWPVLKSFPFKAIPSLDDIPPSIYVSLDNDEAFTPQTEVLLDYYSNELKLGLTILKKLTDKCFVSCSASNKKVQKLFSTHITHHITGDYPANDPGVFLYYNKKDKSENNSWGIKIEDVIRIGMLCKSGKYPTERIISLGGPLVKKPIHVKTREGAEISSIIDGQNCGLNSRIIAGGLLTGRNAGKNSFLGYYEFAINVIKEGQDLEILSFMKMGLDKPTVSNAYISSLIKNKSFEMHSGLFGGHRACIACNACPSVCPVGIYPQLLMKSVKAGDLEESLQHGLLDCVECGLCTYVCPSKIELSDIFEKEKKRLSKEVLG